MQSGTAATAGTTLQCRMHFQQAKTGIGALWIVAAGIVATMGPAFSVTRALLLAVLGLVPPLLMLVLWNPPTQTLSESIREARR